MKYLKRFLKHNDYTEWTNSTGYTAPSVAICLEDDHTHFHPFTPTPSTKGDITCVYELAEAGTIRLYGYSDAQDIATSAAYGHNNFSEMSIDGGNWIPAEVYVTLEAGRHTVEFKLIDNSFIERGTFRDGTSEEYPDVPLNELREVTINTPVSQVLYGSFRNEYIEKVTFTQTTPPELVVFNTSPDWFGDTDDIQSYHYPIYVPSESLESYKTASEYWAIYGDEGADRIKPVE